MKKVDMSEQAILRRLKTVDRLRALCLSLMKAKRDSDEKAEQNKAVEERENKFIKPETIDG
jgi:hypothetical protein